MSRSSRRGSVRRYSSSRMPKIVSHPRRHSNRRYNYAVLRGKVLKLPKIHSAKLNFYRLGEISSGTDSARNIGIQMLDINPTFSLKSAARVLNHRIAVYETRKNRHAAHHKAANSHRNHLNDSFKKANKKRRSKTQKRKNPGKSGEADGSKKKGTKKGGGGKGSKKNPADKGGGGGGGDQGNKGEGSGNDPNAKRTMENIKPDEILALINNGRPKDLAPIKLDNTPGSVAEKAATAKSEGVPFSSPLADVIETDYVNSDQVPDVIEKIKKNLPEKPYTTASIAMIPDPKDKDKMALVVALEPKDAMSALANKKAKDATPEEILTLLNSKRNSSLKPLTLNKANITEKAWAMYDNNKKPVADGGDFATVKFKNEITLNELVDEILKNDMILNSSYTGIGFTSKPMTNEPDTNLLVMCLSPKNAVDLSKKNITEVKNVDLIGAIKKQRDQTLPVLAANADGLNEAEVAKTALLKSNEIPTSSKADLVIKKYDKTKADAKSVITDVLKDPMLNNKDHKKVSVATCEKGNESIIIVALEPKAGNSLDNKSIDTVTETEMIQALKSNGGPKFADLKNDPQLTAAVKVAVNAPPAETPNPLADTLRFSFDKNLPFSQAVTEILKNPNFAKGNYKTMGYASVVKDDKVNIIILLAPKAPTT